MISETTPSRIINELTRRHPVIKTLNAEPPAPGWLGKCNALVQATRYAGGQWYLFTDADTCHSKNSLRYAMNCALARNSD